MTGMNLAALRSNMSMADPAPAAQPRFGAYRFYVVGVLMLAYVCAFVDRTILGLLIDPVKHDLGASDIQMSLLSGFAFAIFYTLLGLPCGLLADRIHRPRLILAGIIVWSAMTAACGLARSYAGLFLARVGVGVGEATLSPASYSLLPDYFRREELGLATSIYAMGVSLGGGLAMLIGGAAVQALQAGGDRVLPLAGVVKPWQMAFIVVGLAGLLVAALVATIREPGRSGAKGPSATFGEAVRWISSNRAAFLPVLIGYSLMVIPSYGLVTWVPAFLMRSHGMGPAAAGGALGLMLLVGGTAGMLAGGIASDRLARRGHANAPLRVCLFSIFAQAPLFIGAMLVADMTISLALLALSIFFLSFNGGLQGATIQIIAPARLRGQAVAAYLLCANLIGLGIGPTLTAFITDRVLGDPARIGQSLAITAALALPLAALLIFRALRPVEALSSKLASTNA